MSDYEKWKSVFCLKGKVKENYKTPKQIDDDNSYILELNDFFTQLINDMCINEIDKRYIVIAEDMQEKLNLIVKNYYNGRIFDSYKVMSDLLSPILKSEICLSPISKSRAFNYYIIEDKIYDYYVFFRARLGEVLDINRTDDFKHVPFSKRSIIGNYRFSIAGFPCLYLGSSSYDCWLELGRPSDNLFNVSCILLKEDYKVLNLAFTVGCFLNELNILRKEEDINNLFKLFLLEQVTSFRVKNKNRVFYSEYIISQLITQVCRNMNVQGIAYISKRVEHYIFGKDLAVNLVLFIDYEEKGNYSSKMDDHMIIGTPVNFSDYTKIKSSDIFLEKLPYNMSQRAKTVGIFEHQIPYDNVLFYDYDMYLYKLAKDILGKER